MSTLRYQMVIVWSDKDDCYLVHFPDFPEQVYARGDSYAEAAINGENILQRLNSPIEPLAEPLAESFVKPLAEPLVEPLAESSVKVSSPVVGETALTPAKPSSHSATSPSEEAIADPSPVPQKLTFPVLRTALVSIATSAVAAAVLTALAFVSRDFLVPKQAVSAAPSAEDSAARTEAKPDASQAPSAAKNDPQPVVKANSKPNAETSSSAALQLTLANSITETSAIWAIATYSDESRNINLIVSGAETGLITITDQGSGQPVRTIEAHNDIVRAIAIAPNARQFISSSGDGIKVWNLQTGELLYHLPSSVPVWSVAIAPDESRFISGANDGSITAWDLKTGQALYSNSNSNNATIWSVAVSPDGTSFVSGDSDRTVRQWDLATGQPIKTFTGHQSDVRAVAISPDGKTLASGSWDKTIKLWSLETGELQATLEGHQNNIVSLSISNNGDTLASGSTDTTVKLWSLSDYKLIESLEGHSDWVLATAFKARERTLITSGKDQEIRIWE
ncbi:MAG: hypothetical protein WA947_15855 [Phormidesmis sp.]